MYYYPEFEQHLARIVSYAESSYQKVSSDLKHEISSTIPLILYKTHSEFEQTNLFPGEVPEGVLAFAEHVRGRMVMPIDLSPDELQGLITHELTHVFEFDLIPRNLVQRSVPLWVDEGLADYMRGTWDPLDLMSVRDAAVTEQIPRISRFDEYGGASNPRLVYNLGHAAFEFIEARYGKEGIRQFLYTFRKNIVGGGIDDIYMQAFRMMPDEFDEAFEKWLKERFKPFRDKQRPERLREGPVPQPREDVVHAGLRLLGQPLRRGGGGHHRQPLRGRGRPRPALRPRRQRHQEPHQGLHRRLRGPGHQRAVRGRPLHRLLARRATRSPSSPARASAAASTSCR